MKRKTLRDQVNPDDYWMGFAFWIAAGSRSTDPQGAIVVGQHGTMIAQACDSPPKAMHGDEYFRPAEEAAIQDARHVVFSGATIYITHTPSPESILDIVASDIRRIVYFPTKPLDRKATDIAQRGYIQLQEFKGNLSWMRDHVEVLKSLGVFS